jgi:hypothetical protein
MHSFIKQMILRNTVNAALQRACVYDDGADTKLKEEFKVAAKQWLMEFGERYKRPNTNPELWCDEIQSLSEILNQGFGPYLRDGKIKLGISQKMVSLYLKYLWLISGDQDKKPLFAVLDRGIMKAASVTNAPNWTHLDDKNEYIRVVEAVDEHAQRVFVADGAQWEADEWPGMNDDD